MAGLLDLLSTAQRPQSGGLLGGAMGIVPSGYSQQAPHPLLPIIDREIKNWQSSNDPKSQEYVARLMQQRQQIQQQVQQMPQDMGSSPAAWGRGLFGSPLY